MAQPRTHSDSKKHAHSFVDNNNALQVQI